MKNKLATILSTTAFLACALLAPAASKSDIDSHYQRYFAAGKSVVEMTLAKKVDAAEVAKQVDIMVAEAAWMCGEYGKGHPEGAKLLGTVNSNVDAMKKLSFDELESEWHDLGYFKKHDVGLDLSDEDNEHFTDPIHTLVHPLMVLKAAQAYASGHRAEDLQAMKEEMEEGLEQAEKTSSRLAK